MLVTPRMYVGDGANAYIKYDGTKLTWKAANTSLDASGNLTAANADLKGKLTIDSMDNASLGTELTTPTGGTASANGTFITKSVNVTHGVSYYLQWTQTHSVANNGSVEVKIDSDSGGSFSYADTCCPCLRCYYYFTGTTGAKNLTFTVSGYTSGTITVADNVSLKAISSSTTSMIVMADDGKAIELRASNTVAQNNIFFGLTSGENNTTGQSNSAIGAYALQNNTTGHPIPL